MKIAWVVSLGVVAFLGALFSMRCMEHRDYRALGLGVAYATAACIAGILANHV